MQVTLPKDTKHDFVIYWRVWLGFVCLFHFSFKASVPEVIDTHHSSSAVDGFPSSALSKVMLLIWKLNSQHLIFSASAQHDGY